MKAEKIETGNLNVPQLYEMEKVSEQENVAEKYPEKVFELQTILRQVRNKRDVYKRQEQPDANIAWKEIKVPGNWEVQGYGVAIYTNHGYEFKPRNPQPPQLPEANPVGVYQRCLLYTSRCV